MSAASESGSSLGRVEAVERWSRGTESARSLLALGIAIVLTGVVIELLTGDSLGWLFDIGFVAACILIALRVRPGEFTTVAAWPPVIMLVVVWLLAWTSRPVIAQPHDSLIQTLVTGLANHAIALGLGYGLCVGILLWRQRRLIAG